MSTKTTADQVIERLQAVCNLAQLGSNQYRGNSPFRDGSDSRAFTLTITDGEHGAYYDHVSGESGSLYDLAEHLGITLPSKRAYASLDDYAAQHNATRKVFEDAGWRETTYHDGRPALAFPTANGIRYRFLDDGDSTYINPKGYKRCWYRLERATQIARDTDQSLAICNGEASTIVAQFYGVAACCVTGGEKKSIPDNLLAELKKQWDGAIIVVFDCDRTGRTMAPPLAEQLRAAGYEARAVDLDGGVETYDLADFCGRHGINTAGALQECETLDLHSFGSNGHHQEEDAGRKRKKRPKSADYIQALKGLGYSFRLNECNDNVEVNGEPMSDVLKAKLRAEMRDEGFRYVNVMEDAYTAHAYDNRYHPVREYLNGLGWDGEDHIAELAGSFVDVHEPIPCSDGVTRTVFHTWLRRWLVGSIAKALEAKQNMMLVLDGPQDIGKSFFVSWLCPLPDYFIESSINPDDKDSFVRLISKWVWEVAELGATTRRADREALKHFITTRTVTVRKAFGRYDITKPAMASLIGTINNESGFLNDPTGNRRFLAVTLESINWSYTRLDVSQIWAQAHALFKAGEPYRLTPIEKAMQRQINGGYEVEDPMEDWLTLHFVIDPGSTLFTATAEILKHLESHGMRGNTRSLSMQLAAAAKKMGLQKSAPHERPRGYYGIRPRLVGEVGSAKRTEEDDKAVDEAIEASF